jgi:hypothetical protein
MPEQHEDYQKMLKDMCKGIEARSRSRER